MKLVQPKYVPLFFTFIIICMTWLKLEDRECQFRFITFITFGVTHLSQILKVNACQSAITCSKLTIEKLEQVVKYVQS